MLEARDTRYVIFDGSAAIGTELSLASSYIAVRGLAAGRPGRKFSVERDDVVVATCEVINGKLKGWVR